jgi:transcriptional regulator GlxA family with amidase domain
LREFASVGGMSATVRWQPRYEHNRRLLRARDAIDRSYASQLDVQRLARIALVSEAHFIRTFKTTIGETPYRYGNRIRIGQITGE